MEHPRSPLLSWPYYYQGKSMEELRQSLLYTTMELESTRLAAQEEITKREDKITRLEQLLNKAIKEKKEAQDKCSNLLLVLLEKQVPHQKSVIISSIEDEHNVKIDGLSSSDCEESIVSSPPGGVADIIPQPPTLSQENALELLSTRKPLPEKGKLLQAVMNAGPLLQTLILAGPLPQWQHPPPPLETFDIPLVEIPTRCEEFLVNGSNCGVMATRKRSFVGGFDGDSSETSKYQKVLFP